MSNERFSRLHEIVAVAIKNQITPQKIGFADFVIRFAESKYGVSKSTAKSYVITLVDAWRHDRWITMVRDNPNLTPEEKREWMRKWRNQ